jgi:hypothetical protein
MESLASPLNQELFSISNFKIPKLLMKAQLYVESPEDRPQIYTAETCCEVQRLLTFVLLHFRSSLRTLVKYKEPPQGTQVIEFERAVYRLVASGLLLRGLSYSSFIEQHIHRLQLCDPPPDLPKALRLTIAQEIKDLDEDERNDALAIQELYQLLQHDSVNSDRRALAVEEQSSYGRWLRMQCSTFESIANIIGAISLISKPVSIKVIAATLPPKTVDKWEDVVTSVFTNPSTTINFPTTPANSPTAPIRSSIVFPSETVPGTLSTSCTHQDAIKIIEKVIQSLKTKKFYFSGSIHCEATLAGLMLSGQIPVGFIVNKISY